MKYAWIAKHKALWPVTLACEVLGVSASGYFEHWRRKDADKPSRPGANKLVDDNYLGRSRAEAWPVREAGLP